MNPLSCTQWTLLLCCALIIKKDRRYGFSSLDLFLMFVLSCIGSLIASFWLYGFWLDGSILHADFMEYCTGTSSPFILTTGISSKRSMLPLLLPRLFYEQWGVFDALAIASICSLALTAWCIGLWARILGGRTAGYVAIFTTLCLGPLCLMGHIVSSYPEMSLCFIIGAMTTTLALCKPSKKTFILAGVGIGLTLLADPRGLLWGLSYTGLIALRLIFYRQRLSAIVLFSTVLYGSWLFGTEVYVPEAIGFEEQVDFRPMLHRVLQEKSPYSPPFTYDSRWVWGLVPVQEAWKTLTFLYAQSQLSIPDIPVSNEVQIARTLIGYYLTLSITFLGIALLLFRKHPWRLLALGTTIPFLVGLYGNQTMLENHARFYLNTLPALALLIALVWTKIGFSRGRWPSLSISIIIWLAILVGIINTPLSPTAGWQHRFSSSDPYFSNLMSQYKNGEMIRKPDLRHCFRALQSLELDEEPMRVRIYEP